MPYPLPTLADRIIQVQANFAARIPGADLSLRRGMLPVIAKEVAAGNVTELGFMTYIVLQQFLDTCTSDILDRQAALYDIDRPAAAPSAGAAIVTGNGGSVLAAETLLQTTDGSVQFTIQNSITLTGTIITTGTVELEATTGGSDTNVIAGAPLQFVVAIAGVQPIATVGSLGLTGGSDQGTDAELLAEVLARLQTPPQGGADPDYVAWAKLVPACTRAWVYPQKRGLGTVDVCFVCDGRSNIIPLSADITAVQASIDANRPVTADCQVFAPGAITVNVTVTNLVITTGSVLATVEAAIQASLVSLFGTATPAAAAFGDGVIANVAPGVIYVEQIDAAVANTPGVSTFDLTAPPSDADAGSGSISILGVVTIST